MVGSEFRLIARFTRQFDEGRGVVQGPGDDAALLRPRAGFELAVTTDTLREGIHFGPLFRPTEIGHKALAVNLSDLAAMGARPRWFLVALELKPPVHLDLIDGLARGMSKLAQQHDCSLVGGNLTHGERLALTLTALGEIPRGRALRRDGLRPGDLLAVTGDLGAAAWGLRHLSTGRRSGAGKQLQPIPRVAAGLAARGMASAAIDVSDGLAQDLGHLCDASGCGAEIWADTFPTSQGVGREPDWLALCLTGGEDYELLIGCPSEAWPRLRRAVERTGTRLTRIGRALPGSGLQIAAHEGGRAKPLHAPGFSHFQ